MAKYQVFTNMFSAALNVMFLFLHYNTHALLVNPGA